MKTISSMILVMIEVFPLAEKRSEVIDVFTSLLGPVGSISGCLDCSVTAESPEDGAICYMEKWRSRLELDRHLQSPSFGSILEVMELSSKSPKVIFYEVVELGGLDLLETVRSVHPTDKGG